MPTRNRVAVVGLSVVLAAIGVPWVHALPEGQRARRMPDGKEWMTTNLNIVVSDSYCYDNAETNCTKYGRLYTWTSAQQACRSLANGWRLPTNDEWRLLVKQFGGVRDDSDDGGKAAFPALVSGGRSGFDVLFGGGREPDGQYARMEAHGFYWTATESDAGHAWLYNFGGQRFVNRHEAGEKSRAFSVRCIRD
jgi:uncharacterized protein (TIGR02145 family)